MNTDDWLVDNVFDKHLPLACKLNVHPNIITIVALVLSALIPFMHTRGHTWLVFWFLIVRQLCDTLDGAVARRCKKTSRLGGLLDSVADIVVFYSITFVVLSFFMGASWKTYAAAGGVMVVVLAIHFHFFDTSTLYDHAGAKKNGTKTIYKDVFATIANNSMVASSVFALLYVVYVRHLQT